MRLHTRVAAVMLTAGAVGAGVLTTGAVAAPSTTTTASPSSSVTVVAPRVTTAGLSAHDIAVRNRAAHAKAAARVAAANRAAPAHAARAAVIRSKAVKVALAKVRQHPQYVAGGRGPRVFDCAGFTSWVWKTAGHRIADNTWGQRASLRKVSKAQARPGDIVLYMNGAHHSEIYLGHGKTVGCSNSRTDCKVKPLSGWYAAHFSGFYRVV